MAGGIHLFKISGKLMTDKVKLNKQYISYILEIDWSKDKVTFIGIVIKFAKINKQ